MRDIVNGAQLAGFVGKEISITGDVQEALARGTTFKLRSTDNIMVTVNLQTPLTKPLEGYVEVHGTCKGRTVVEAENFISFSNKEFDSTNHNVLCKLLHSIPNLW